MRRVQVELNDELATYLDQRSAATGKTVATAIVDIVADQRATDERQRRIDVALAALEKPPFHSGVANLGENHDEYIGQVLDEEVERWRRG